MFAGLQVARMSVGRSLRFIAWWVAAISMLTTSLWAGGPLARARGEANSLLASAKALHQRVDQLDPRSEAGWQAANLYRLVEQMKEQVYCEAEVEMVLHSLQMAQGVFHGLEHAMAQSCHLRDDRRVRSESNRVADRLCDLEKELMKCRFTPTYTTHKTFVSPAPWVPHVVPPVIPSRPCPTPNSGFQIQLQRPNLQLQWSTGNWNDAPSHPSFTTHGYRWGDSVDFESAPNRIEQRIEQRPF